MDMIHRKNGFVFTDKAAVGAKEAAKEKRGGFFSRMWESCRPKTLAERNARGDALFSKAGKLADEAGEGKPPLEAILALTDALREYAAIYYKTSRKYNGGASLTERESSETLALMRKARAGKAVCYYGLGRLHERRNDIESALSYYSEAERVKVNAIVLNANYPDDCATDDAAKMARLAIERLGQN